MGGWDKLAVYPVLFEYLGLTGENIHFAESEDLSGGVFTGIE